MTFTFVWQPIWSMSKEVGQKSFWKKWLRCDKIKLGEAFASRTHNLNKLKLVEAFASRTQLKFPALQPNVSNTLAWKTICRTCRQNSAELTFPKRKSMAFLGTLKRMWQIQGGPLLKKAIKLWFGWRPFVRNAHGYFHVPGPEDQAQSCQPQWRHSCGSVHFFGNACAHCLHTTELNQTWGDDGILITKQFPKQDSPQHFDFGPRLMIIYKRKGWFKLSLAKTELLWTLLSAHEAMWLVLESNAGLALTSSISGNEGFGAFCQQWLSLLNHESWVAIAGQISKPITWVSACNFPATKRLLQMPVLNDRSREMWITGMHAWPGDEVHNVCAGRYGRPLHTSSICMLVRMHCSVIPGIIPCSQHVSPQSHA